MVPSTVRKKQALARVFALRGKKKTWTPEGNLSKEQENNNDLVASMYMRDGIHGRKIGYSLEPERLALYRLYHSQWWRLAYTIAATIHIALAFFERPSSLKDRQRELRSDWDIGLGSIEAACLCVYLIDLKIWISCFGLER